MLRRQCRTLVIAGVLVFTDAFVINQGIIAALGALIGGIPRALFTSLGGEASPGRRGSAGPHGTEIYVAVAVLVLRANFAIISSLARAPTP